MEEDKCFRCLRDNKQVKLVDVIYGNEILKVCEECALTEELPVIRKPSSFQLRATEKPYSVYERLSRMAGLKKDEKPEIKFRQEKQEITLDKLRKPKDYSQVLARKTEQARRINKPLDLIDNYHWHIMMERRKRKMSINQLAGIIGENEQTIKMIEQGNLPDDANKVIGKIEQFFKINLRKSEMEREQARLDKVRQPARVLSFDSNTLENLTISDLKRMKEQKNKASIEQADKELASKIVWQGGKKPEARKERKTEEKEDESDIEIIDE